MSQRVVSIIIWTLVLFVAMMISNHAVAQSKHEINTNSRVISECGIRANILQLSINAYTSRAWVANVRSQKGAVDYVIEQTSNQNLKKKESEALIRRIVKYVYYVLRPQISSPNEVLKIKDDYYRQCMFDPEKEIGNFYVVDLKKTFSKNTDGEYIIQNKDGSETVCHQGKCKLKEPEPPSDIGVAYDKTRKIVKSLGWSSAPSAMQPILIKTGRLYTNGKKIGSNEMYGNCLIENATCDKSMPELADCSMDGECTAVWSKNGATVWYVIRNGIVKSFGSAPAHFTN